MIRVDGGVEHGDVGVDAEVVDAIDVEIGVIGELGLQSLSAAKIRRAPNDSYEQPALPSDPARPRPRRAREQSPWPAPPSTALSSP